MKFKRLIIAFSIFISLVCMYIFISKPYLNKIELKINSNTLNWTLKDQSNSNHFLIYQNGEELENTNTFEYIIKSPKDTTPPNKINKISTFYSEDAISFSWDSPEDNGTNNTFQIFLVDENKKIKGKSNIVNYNYKTSTKNYEFTIGDKTFKTTECTISINRDDILNKREDIEIKAFDKNDNFSSNIFKNGFINYKIMLNEDNGNYIINNPDSEQGYEYTVYCNGATTKINGNEFNINSVFKDVLAPDMPKFLKVNRVPGKSMISWDEIMDKKNIATFKIEGTGEEFNNQVSVSLKDISMPSGKVSYRYSLTSSPETITKVDKLTSSNSINLNFNDGTYYFNIASEDESGNLSKTYNKKIFIKSKEDALNNIIQRNENVDDPLYLPYYNCANNYLPQNTALLLDEIGTKINIVNEDINKIYENFAKKPPSEPVAGFYTSLTNTIYIEVNNPDNVILHEIGHAVDTYFSRISTKDEFMNVYNEEKDSIFGDPHDPLSLYAKSSSAEYFAQCFEIYLEDEDVLKSYAPKTYDIIDNLVNSI